MTELVVAITLAAGCTHRGTELAVVTRAQLATIREGFNAGDGPRVIVFLSSACASCDTGSAALEAMLETLHEPVTVFAIWEPIAASDAGNLTDRRVHQMWDPTHVMSDEMRACELAHPGSLSQTRARTDCLPTGIMYDTVAVFAPGSRWDATLPAPAYLELGLEAKLGELAATIRGF